MNNGILIFRKAGKLPYILELRFYCNQLFYSPSWSKEILSKDTIFSELVDCTWDFTFDEKVADVFPDMIQRSVPGYGDIISAIGLLTRRFGTPDSNLYDLGCSLGAATISMCGYANESGCKVFAIDNSPHMVKRCQLHVNDYGSDTPVEVMEADIRDVTIRNASVVVLNFTLQFLSIHDRQPLLEKIYRGLNRDGILIISDKFAFENASTDRILTALHHDFKRANHYSELEISQKKAAIKNVLRPESITTYRNRLNNVGFKSTAVWYQHFNFGSMFALK